MNVSGDANRRVRITKAALKHALYEELQKKPLNKISVREIAEKADVSRGTFYLHYQDVFDMVEKQEDEMVRKIGVELSLSGESNLENLTIVFERLFRMIQENPEDWMLLSLANGGAGVKQKLFSLLQYRTNYNLGKLFEVTKDQEAYMTALVINGCIGLVEQWLKDGAKEEPAVLAAVLSAGTEAQKTALAKTQSR